MSATTTKSTNCRFNVGDIVRHRYIVLDNGEDPGTHQVKWVSGCGTCIQIDFGDGEILVCAAASYVSVGG